MAMKASGVEAEVVHLNQFLQGKKKLSSYHGLIIPGGFSFGDHIRSGAIFGRVFGQKLESEINEFKTLKKPILGICNGFQVLIESGLLPGYSGLNNPELALGTNISSKFEDRWVHMKNDNKGKCIFTKGIKRTVRMPVANGEGRLIFPINNEKELLKKMVNDDLIVFRYTTARGNPASGSYPENPSGSYSDIAGICDDTGLIFGLMPHPERAFSRLTYPDWTRTGNDKFGDGYLIFKNMADYIKKKFSG